ncbi:MAG: protein kinase [Chloroflexota bacterium]
MNLATGQVVRGYELHEPLGIGGFGAVYRAYQPAVKRDVAIKIILPQYANQPDFIRSFEAEAQLVARLEHLHIVPLYDYWREPNGAYLVMRWLRGGNLRGKLQEGPLDLDAVAIMLDQTAGALTVAHRRGVIHRDIKPDNILLDEEGNTYLSDFGIAQDITALGGNPLEEYDQFAGSLTYTSPEQIRGEPPTPATDIYSLGIVLYEALTGEHPFPNAQPAELITKHLNEPVPELRQRFPDLGPEMDVVIQRATAKDPNDRFPDPLTMAAAFRRALKASKRRTALLPSAGPSAQLADTTPTPFSVLIPELETPYKGLRPFQEADAAEFFGREALIEHLITRMAEADNDPVARFLAVVGPSGSGKSSAVMAGLIPALRAGALSGSRDWFIADMSPGRHPFTELESALLGVAVNPPDDLLAQLTSSERGLVTALRSALPADDTCFLLVIDQFEELFIQCESEEHRALFLKSLATAVLEPECNIRIVITLRADFYDRPLMYPGFGDLMRTRTDVVLPLNIEELQRAIVEPASRAGVELEPGLVTAIVADVSEQPGALPLLQYALTELFERRDGRMLRLATYYEIGGALGALAQRADELYGGLDDAGKNAAQQLFLRLVAAGDGDELARRRLTRSEALSLSSDESVMEAVIDTFGKHRLLTFDRDPSTRAPTIEVAHEALIHQWARLRGWLDQHREDLLQQRRLGAAAGEWHAAGRDPSFLARGIRLEQFIVWSENTTMALNQIEREFLQSSIEARNALLAEEADQRRREQILEQRSRNRLRVLALVLLLSTVGALGLTTIALNQSEIAQRNAATATYAQGIAYDEAINAQTQAAIAEHNALEARSLALAASSQLALKDGNSDLAVLLALEANRLASPQQARLALADVDYSPGTKRQLSGHRSGIADVAISANERTVASGARDGSVFLWSAITGDIIHVLEGHTDRVTAVTFSPDGETLATGSWDGSVRLWDVETGQELRRFDHPGAVLAAEFSQGGRSLVTGGSDGIVRVWETETGNLRREFSGHTGPINSVAFSADSRMIVSGSADRTVRVWNLTTASPVATFEGHTDRVTAVGFASDNRLVASGSMDASVRLWDIDTGQEVRRYSAHTDSVTDLTFDPTGNYLLTTSLDSSMIMWDVERAQVMHRFLGHQGPITSVVISRDGDTAVTGSEDMTLRIWELNSGSETRRMRFYVNEVTSVAVSPEGRTAVVAGQNDSFVLWDLASGQQIRRFFGHTGDVLAVRFSRRGERIASSGTDGRVIIWDTETATPLMELRGHDDIVTSIDFAVDGQTMLTGSWDGTIILWDIETGRQLRRLIGHQDRVLTAVFTADGRGVLSGSNDGIIIFWDVETGEEIRRFTSTHSPITSIAASPNGHRFIAGSNDGLVRQWELTTGEEINRFVGHRSSVTTVALTPDGATALSGSRDRSLILWDIESGALIYRFEGHEDVVTSVAFIRGGLQAISGSRDRTVRVWRTLSLNTLVEWTYSNRYIPPLDCERQAQYRIEVLCSATAEAVIQTNRS